MSTTTLNPAKSIEANDISYCCSSASTFEVNEKICAWIARHESLGWKVEFSVRQEPSGNVGVMWQCISHADGHYQEFSPCISMCGREFLMN